MYVYVIHHNTTQKFHPISYYFRRTFFVCITCIIYHENLYIVYRYHLYLLEKHVITFFVCMYVFSTMKIYIPSPLSYLLFSTKISLVGLDIITYSLKLVFCTASIPYPFWLNKKNKRKCYRNLGLPTSRNN